MIQIINEQGRILELDDNTVMAVERNNALFSTDDAFKFDLTYNASAGLTDNNKAFIQGGHLVEASNSVYEFPVQVFVSGYNFYKALFSYKEVKGKISYILKVNFGAVVAKMKSTNIRDIYSQDGNPTITTAAAAETFMYQRASLPWLYPFTFFSVYNDSWSSNPTSNTSKWINEWNPDTQKFVTSIGTSRPEDKAISPFFKLSYIIKKICEYLKFNVTGSAMDDPWFSTIYIHTREILPFGTCNVGPSMDYMPPNLSIIDFFKFVTDRTKITFDFDLLNSLVTIETLDGLLKSPDCIDISGYIESIDEKSTAEQKGYTITLKVDESDTAMNMGTEDEQKYDPPYALVIGSGENKIEMEIGTLAQKQDGQRIYPISNQIANQIGALDELTDWPLRLIRYTGIFGIASGLGELIKLYPQARAVELTDRDALWYRFLNDSKTLKITAKIPPSIVAKMKPIIKLGCKSDQGTFFYAIPEKNSYALSNTDTDLITVTIESRSLVADYLTKFYIDDLRPEDTDVVVRSTQKFKAYYIPDIHGFQTVKILRFPRPGGDQTYGNTLIDSPTDDGGVGGTIGTTFQVSGSRPGRGGEIFRLYSSVAPRYYINGGIKGTFTLENDYYVFSAVPGAMSLTGKPCWIVF